MVCKKLKAFHLQLTIEDNGFFNKKQDHDESMSKMIKEWAHLKQGAHEACNNVKSCKITTMLPLTLAKNVDEKKHVRTHLEP
jgi:hypothetical protein